MTDLSRTIAEYLGPWNVGPELFAGLLRAPSEAAVKLFLTHNRHSPLPPPVSIQYNNQTMNFYILRKKSLLPEAIIGHWM